MEVIVPKKLSAGGHVRVIAPAQSLAIISEDVRRIAARRFESLGLRVSFGTNAEEINEFGSSSVSARVADLHEAFADPTVTAVFSAIGGFTSNQMLRYIDWDLIRANPKLFCGYSDVTVLNNALLTKANLMSYSGLHYSSFGQRLFFDYTFEYFKRCLMGMGPFQVWPSESWSDDKWYLDQNARDLIRNRGWVTINDGEATGRIVGGNLESLNLLQGTEYFPDLTDTILFLEDDLESQPQHFDRDLQSLMQQPNFEGVRGMVIGRFQKNSNMTVDKLTHILQAKPELSRIPIIINVDYGHTDPKIVIPIGGIARIVADDEVRSIEIVEH